MSARVRDGSRAKIGYSVARVAHLLNVHRVTVCRWIRKGKLAAVQFEARSPYHVSRAALAPLVLKLRQARHL